MTSIATIIAAFAVLTFAYQAGYRRSIAVADGQTRALHSRPTFYGAYVLAWCAIPAAVLLLAWSLLQPFIIDSLVLDALPENVRALPEQARNLQVLRINNTVAALEAGRDLPRSTPDYVLEAAQQILRLQAIGQATLFAAVLVAALVGLGYGWTRVSPQLRARNRVETIAIGIFILCSSVAILTTIGIVLSVLFEALRFFSFIPPAEFFFGLVWDPRFPEPGSTSEYGQFGLIPLLWGTIFISFIAMMVAAPIGLLSAIYLSEYAYRRVRNVAKPLLEILAGIPTVVYGFFALSTVGPFLRDLGTTVGVSVSPSSALVAGAVMGIMIIPFVSSLSDDIINAVPQSLRDGSYGIGATRSETIKRVILPAALPGIVGALLLAVSRAIGETMIVVMAAGIAARITANPFEAVTTVTVKIVTQLTGDQEFTSPQALVAFALGLTLFVITLCLNVIALVIVRKYREQYE
ncbi:MAG TPA: phosphate ABC transporter permease subunit PstC [Alphaproteobacteria bacterium]|nr:phosphate ABC transporter permease subunit PstC [Alphaproteobacteria bacterium]